MKRLFIAALICLYPLTVFSHPGKTDRYGGHRCLKGCKEWGLFRDEYHLHDKDWKPIRISKKKTAARKPRPEKEQQAPEEAAQMPVEQVNVAPDVAQASPPPEERVIVPDILLWMLLLLLMLLLIHRLRRKKGSETEGGP